VYHSILPPYPRVPLLLHCYHYPPLPHFPLFCTPTMKVPELREDSTFTLDCSPYHLPPRRETKRESGRVRRGEGKLQPRSLFVPPPSCPDEPTQVPVFHEVPIPHPLPPRRETKRATRRVRRGKLLPRCLFGFPPSPLSFPDEPIRYPEERDHSIVNVCFYLSPLLSSSPSFPFLPSYPSRFLCLLT
jgi:hypothetical protein